MNTKFVTLLLALLPLTTVACTRPHAEAIALNDKPATTLNQSEYSGYIVTALNEGEAAIRRTYAKFGVKVLRSIGNGHFELRLQNDPGLSELESLATRSGGSITAIQPNYIYKAF